MKPCLECGEPTELSRCQDCTAQRPTSRGPARQEGTAKQRGYDAAWVRLSRQARRLTPWCADAHLSPCRGVLTTDHLPGAWDRRARGERLTLADVEVVCAGHNSARGARRRHDDHGGMG